MSPLLAETAVTASQAQVLIYVVIAAVFVGGLGSVRAALDIVRFFRGDPPSDVRFASKAELAALAREVEAVEIRAKDAVAKSRDETARVESGLAEIFRELRTMHTAIGRVEGELKARAPANLQN